MFTRAWKISIRAGSEEQIINWKSGSQIVLHFNSRPVRNQCVVLNSRDTRWNIEEFLPLSSTGEYEVLLNGDEFFLKSDETIVLFQSRYKFSDLKLHAETPGCIIKEFDFTEAEWNSVRRESLRSKLAAILESGGVRRFGNLPLEQVCTLTAKFQSGYYDSFVVKDSSILREAIAKDYPRTALEMKEDLHMTVSYPSRGRVPGLSDCAARIFGNSSDFPDVLLHISEIYVSREGNLAAAVISAIDTPVLFDFNNDNTPAHLTLWGAPPVMAGRMLCGKSLALRAPFIQVTVERIEASMEANIMELDALKESLASTTKELSRLREHSDTLDKLLVRRVIKIQVTARKWLAYKVLTRMRKMKLLTNRQRNALLGFLQNLKQRVHDNWHHDYGEYGEYDYYYY